MTLDNGTDGQTDRRTDRVRRNMRPPPKEEGRIITRSCSIITARVTEVMHSTARINSDNLPSYLAESSLTRCCRIVNQPKN